MISNRNGVAPLVALSPREADILRFVVQHRSIPDIAVALDLAPKSVSDYIWRLCQGLGLRSKMELLLWGMQNPGAIGEDRLPARAGLHPKDCTCDSGPCTLARSLPRQVA